MAGKVGRPKSNKQLVKVAKDIFFKPRKKKSPTLTEEQRDNLRKRVLHPNFQKNMQKGHTPTIAIAARRQKSRAARLITEAAKNFINDPAPDEACTMLGLELGSTFAECLAKKQMIDGLFGSLASTQYVQDLTEGKYSGPNQHEAAPPNMVMVFSKEETPVVEEGKTIDAR